MLENLDTLDDATPPAPDDTMLKNVRGRADRLRRRTRATAIGAGVVLLAVVVGIATTTHDPQHHVSVINPSSSSTTVPATVPATTPTVHGRYFVTGTLPNGLSVRMNLDHESVQIGNDIPVEVIVTNNTFKNQTLGVGPVQCVLNLGLVLRDEEGHVVADDRRISCISVGRGLARDQSLTIPSMLSTQAVTLTAGEKARRFELRLERLDARATDPPPAGSIGPLPIFVVGPPVTARLVVPVTTARAGAEITGAVEIENSLNARIKYLTGCDGGNPWEVALGQNGAAFPIPIPQGPCVTESKEVPPGTTRVGFRVQLRNWSCAETAIPAVHTPKCQNGSPPPLEPGSYELVFQVRGPGVFRAIEVPPVSITVVG